MEVEKSENLFTDLKGNEIEVLELLLLGKPVSEIAEKLQISRQAVYKILKRERFQRALLQARGELLKEIIFKLRVVVTKAVEVLLAELDKDTTYRWRIAVELLKALDIEGFKGLDEKELAMLEWSL